ATAARQPAQQTLRPAPPALQSSFERAAQDGDWYRRGDFADGTPLGSAACFLRLKSEDERFDGLLLSESALAKDCNAPEEDAAWASL
ncbi:MAG TPA: hypothetical protein VF515_00825, partial [Candidatus Binatia bacterium]